jgi:hypothetical protein
MDALSNYHSGPLWVVYVSAPRARRLPRDLETSTSSVLKQNFATNAAIPESLRGLLEKPRVVQDGLLYFRS